MNEAQERVVDAKVDELIDNLVLTSRKCGVPRDERDEPFHVWMQRRNDAQEKLEEYIAEIRHSSYWRGFAEGAAQEIPTLGEPLTEPQIVHWPGCNLEFGSPCTCRRIAVPFDMAPVGNYPGPTPRLVSCEPVGPIGEDLED